MKIPKTTKEQPHIQYCIHNSGKITFELSSDWWGVIGRSFIGSGGTFGNSCLPKDLKRFIKRTLDDRVKKIDKEIKELESEKKKAIDLNIKFMKLNDFDNL